jgi:hypothetical protein
VIEEITDITRTIEVSVAELNADHLQMIENAPAIDTVAPVAGASAQDVVRFGGFGTLKQYRFAFISRRSGQSGMVVETGGKERGRFFMGVAYRAQLTADSVDLEQAKGDLSAAGTTFRLFPEPGQEEGEEYGAWFDEMAGTIGA